MGRHYRYTQKEDKLLKHIVESFKEFDRTPKGVIDNLDEYIGSKRASIKTRMSRIRTGKMTVKAPSGKEKWLKDIITDHFSEYSSSLLPEESQKEIENITINEYYTNNEQDVLNILFKSAVIAALLLLIAEVVVNVL